MCEEKKQLYALYQKRCETYSLVDFGELLMRAAELWQNNPDLLARYRERFRWLLVDEFQDTNGIQYNWLKAIVRDHRPALRRRRRRSVHLPLAGRAGGEPPALHAAISRTCARCAWSATTGLRRPYSRAANAVIAHNASRFSKKLWTRGEEGAPVRLFAAYNEWDEANHVVSRVRSYAGQSLRDLAVLYRSNAQSRVFEEALVSAGIPYRVYGGLRFFERAEIKDALAYLRLVANRGDDPSFERVVNNPPRRIGEATLRDVRGHARPPRPDPLGSRSRGATGFSAPGRPAR